jgi:hypothetical protein
MLRIPENRAPMVFGIIQAGLTSLIASGLGVLNAIGLSPALVPAWVVAWLAAWATMLPVVVFAAPHIQRAALAVVRWSNRGAA